MRFLCTCALASLLAIGPAFSGDLVVTDDTGRTVSIQEHPKRIVVTHEPLLGVPLMDLGLDLVGSYGRSDDGKFVVAVDFIDTVLGEGRLKPRGFGPFGQPDLEKLQALKPDLIIATEMDAGKAEQFGTVAPVYLQNIGGTKVHGIDVQAKLAAVVGLQDEFESRKAEYLFKVDALRTSLPQDPKHKTYLAIFLTDQLNVVGNSSGMVQALEDLGYTRLEVDETNGIASGGGSMMLMPISAEAFGKLNPDILILLNSYMGSGRDAAGTHAKLDTIVPGWEKFMKPALEHRVLVVDPALVITPSLASAEHMLDAINAWSDTHR